MSKWKKVKLGDLCDIQSGGTPSRSNKDYWVNGTVPWVKIGDIKSKYVEDTKEYITDLGLQNSSAKLLDKGTILYTIFATLGETAILNIDACTNQAIAGLKITSGKVLTDFLFYFLISKKQSVIEIGRGVAQNNINLSILKNMQVKLPPLDEQKKISNELDKTTDIITKRKIQLEKLDLLVKSRFIEMFGEPETNTKHWCIMKLADLCSVGSSKRVLQSEQSNCGVPFLRVSDLVRRMDTDELSSDLFITEERFVNMNKHGQVPTEGDILVTSRGTLGRCYIWREKDRFYFQDGMISWLSKFSECITPAYIAFLFSMAGFRKQIDKLQAGSTVAYLSISMIRQLEVMVPDVALQTQFSTFVHQVDKSKF
ncbi:MAG: restriction endonuclease subunit S, partial [Oscillospiraceae bacterium]